MRKQRFGLDGDCSVESFPDTPSAVELIYDQIGIPIDRNPPWRARTQTFQDMKDSGIFRHTIGYGAALASKAVSLRDDWLICPATASTITPALL